MDSERWQKIKRFLNQLDDAPEATQRQMLLELSQHDPQLYQEVESYLPFGAADSFIDEPVWSFIPDNDPTYINSGQTSPGSFTNGKATAQSTTTRIGPYRLERLLGRGGMGQVHLAVREDDYEQKVAIKRTLGSVARGEMEARFANERQILANLQHPGIARLLDGGTDDDGSPYLVMEYVEGETIDVFCAQHDVSLRQRLRLFRQVCKAVHYAHQNLIVHRDLKPGNILVTVDGKPRLLDFGIAKLLQESQDAQVTKAGRVALTPSCASPEQLMGEPITTASDVYALGLLLYQLLTDRKPYNADGLDFAALIRQVCFKEPTRPSSALGTPPGSSEPDQTQGTTSPSILPGVPSDELEQSEASVDSSDKRKLRRKRRQLEGDLDAIVMKAIRKEPTHRYASAADLADDVLNYLEGLPVQARKGNWIYHTNKLLRRNRPALAVLLLIIGLALTSTVMWQRAEIQKAQAITAQTHSRVFYDFLTNMLTSADPNLSKGKDLTVKEVVEKGKDDIETSLAGMPQLQAEMYGTFSKIYYTLGAREDSLKMRKLALARYRDHSSAPSEDLAVFTANLGKGYFGVAKYSAAEQHFLESIEIRRRLGASEQDLSLTLNSLAASRLHLGKYALAEEGFKQVVRIRDEARSSLSDRSFAHHSLGTFYKNTGVYSQAISTLEHALGMGRQAHGPLHLRVASTLSALGESYLGAGRLEDALVAFRQALSIRRQLLGPQDGRVGSTHTLIAKAYLRSGRLEDAEHEIELALGILRQTQNEGHWLIAAAETVKAELLTLLDENEAAETMLLRSLQTLREQKGPCDPNVIYSVKILNRLCESVDKESVDKKAEARTCRADLTSLGCEELSR